MRELTKAQQSLVKLVEACGWMGITRREVERLGLREDFVRCRRARLIESSGYEISTAAAEWLDSEAGRRALQAEGGER